MTSIRSRVFRGTQPKIADQLVGDGISSIAENCDLSSGELRAWKNELKNSDLSSPSSILTIYYYLARYWFEFTADVDVVAGPIASDTTYRRYFTGSGIPKKTNLTEATTGSGAMPINFYPMGVPIPDHAPTAGAGAGGAGETRSVSWKWTVITSWGEESAPSPACDPIDHQDGDTVALSGMTLEWQASQAYTLDSWVIPSVLGDYVYKCVSAGTSAGAEPSWGTTIDGDTADGGCSWRCYKKGILYDSGGAKRIYRTNTGDQYASWQMVADIAMSATTYSDDNADADLESTVCPSDGHVAGSAYWDNPPDTIIGLVSLGSFFAAFTGKSIRFSEPNYPHAWPLDYEIKIDYQAVSMGVVGTSLVVGTENRPYVINGSHPSVMLPAKLSDPYPCISKRGSVITPFGFVYPTTSGFYVIGGDSGDLITKNVLDIGTWWDYYPTTLNAVFHDGKYFGFYSSGDNEGAIIFDMFRPDELTTLDFYAPGIFVDPQTDKLYFTKMTAAVFLLPGGVQYPSRAGAFLLPGGESYLQLP